MTAFIWVEKTLGGVDILINSASATASVPIVGKVQATICRFSILFKKGQRALLLLSLLKDADLFLYLARFFKTNGESELMRVKGGRLVAM